MRIDPIPTQGDDLKSLLEENLKYSKAIYASTEKMRRYMLWGQIFGFIKIFVIIVPLVIGFWYLKPYLLQVSETYQQLLGEGVGANVLPGTSSLNLSTWLQQQLQNSGQLKNLPK
jgi:hypothetical protein